MASVLMNMRAIAPSILASAVLLGACGGQAAPREAEPSPASRPTEATAPLYDLHEWGVIAVREGSFEVAAGAGQRAPQMNLTVDKPVLYVHPLGAAAFDLEVDIRLPATLRVAEHFPPGRLSPPGTLSWTAHVEGQCRGSYPSNVDARCPGGYCEIGELGTYEAEDAACLDVGGVRAPLLFYRLWAPGTPPELPLQVEVQGDTWVVENRAIDAPVGQLWRVRVDGGRTRASAVAMPARGARVSVPSPDGEPALAWADMMRTLRERGLTAPEAAAFERGWGRALFGDAATPADGRVADGTTADREVADEDRASIDELTVDDALTSGLPRDLDVLLYWLPDANIDALAQVTAQPAPRHLRRAFMVRHVIR